MKVLAVVLLATLGGGLLALFGMLFLNQCPVEGDDDIHGGSV